MTNLHRKVQIWGVIPAAGSSRRMGRPKQLLPYQNSTMAATVTRTLLEAGVDGVVIVTRSQLIDALKLPDDDRVHIAINDNTESEMIDSIRIALSELELPSTCGAGSLVPTDGVLVVPADMPTLSPEVCRVCMAAYSTNPQRIVIATHAGKRGHPLIFPLALRTTVDELEEGLRALQRLYPQRIFEVEVEDPSVIKDVDTLKDYEKL